MFPLLPPLNPLLGKEGRKKVGKSDFPTLSVYHLEKAMELVRVKSKFQITIPVSLQEEAGLKVGDMLEVTFENGAIVLRLVAIARKKFHAKD